MAAYERLAFGQLENGVLGAVLRNDANVVVVQNDHTTDDFMKFLMQGNASYQGALCQDFPWQQDDALAHVSPAQRTSKEDVVPQGVFFRTLPRKDVRMGSYARISKSGCAQLPSEVSQRVTEFSETILRSMFGENSRPPIDHLGLQHNHYPTSTRNITAFVQNVDALYARTSTHSHSTSQERRASRIMLLKRLISRDMALTGGKDWSTFATIGKSIPGRIANRLSHRRDTDVVLGPHFDRQIFTVIFGQRKNAQTQFFQKGRWRTVPLADNEMMIFPGLQGAAFGFKPPLHRVIIDDAHPINPRAKRNLSITIDAELAV